MDDPRLIENQNCLDWFQRWERQVQETDGVQPKEKVQMFLSKKTKFDIF